jgi:hypothetical protein
MSNVAADGRGKVSRPLHSQGPRQLAVPQSLSLGATETQSVTKVQLWQ